MPPLYSASAPPLQESVEENSSESIKRDPDAARHDALIAKRDAEIDEALADFDSALAGIGDSADVMTPEEEAALESDIIKADAYAAQKAPRTYIDVIREGKAKIEAGIKAQRERDRAFDTQIADLKTPRIEAKKAKNAEARRVSEKLRMRRKRGSKKVDGVPADDDQFAALEPLVENESRDRFAALIIATASLDHWLRTLRGREYHLVTTWAFDELGRINHGRMPTLQETSDQWSAHAARDLNQVRRDRIQIAKLESRGIWKRFELPA